MSRPVGVTASAITAILGSIMTLLFAVAAVASVFIESTKPKPPNTTQFVVVGAAMFTALAAIGIWTAVGLFRLRPWARTAMLVFAVFIAVSAISTLLVAIAMPPPQDISVDTQRIIRLSMAVAFGIPLAIAVWWLIQFNRPSTKAAFASPMGDVASSRPLSITVIAWMSIVGGASCVLGILTGTPLFLFGVNVTGWTAGVIYAFLAALSLYIGKGLLDLRERARVLAIVWFAFSFVHSSLIALVPSLQKGMLELQQGLDHNQPNPIAFDEGRMLSLIFAFGAIVAAAAIWFLIRNRAAFRNPDLSVPLEP